MTEERTAVAVDKGGALGMVAVWEREPCVEVAVVNNKPIEDGGLDDKPVAHSNLSVDAKLDRRPAIGVGISLIYGHTGLVGTLATKARVLLERGGECKLRKYSASAYTPP